MKPEKKVSKIFIPLYIYFIISLILSSILSGFFEHFSNMPFEELASFVRDNSDRIRIMMSEDIQSESTGPGFDEAGSLLEEEFMSRIGAGGRGEYRQNT